MLRCTSCLLYTSNNHWYDHHTSTKRPRKRQQEPVSWHLWQWQAQVWVCLLHTSTASFKVSKKENLWYDYAIKEGGDLVAVSYTHLDVYKRQLLSRPARVRPSLQLPITRLKWLSTYFKVNVRWLHKTSQSVSSIWLEMCIRDRCRSAMPVRKWKFTG